MKIRSIDWKYLRKLSNFKEWKNSKPTFHRALNFEDVNLIIGGNGAGKSTLIDAIHAISDTEKLKSLPRENVVHSVNPQFSIHFEDKSIASYEYHSISCTQTRLPIRGSFRVDQTLISNTGKSEFYSADFKKIKCTNNIGKLQIKDIEVFYTECDYPQNIQFTQVHIDELNKIVDNLSGMSHKLNPISGAKTRNCFYLNFCGAISLTLDDDDAWDNHIDGKFLPSGLKSFATLICIILALKDNTICLIEEPEKPLHPTLQRVLIKRIIEIAKKKKLQIFLTSHSATIINSLQGESKLFFCTSDHIVEAKMSKHILDKLGYRASDLLQSNGLIWIEGPSDRIYINSWLEAYSLVNKLPKLTENEDYQFSLYGGSTLNHFGTTDDLINIFKGNPNSIMIMDNDNHHINSQFTSETKGRIFLSYVGYETGFCWVTDDYTIESYLPKNFRDKYFIYQNSMLKLNSSYSKVYIANHFSFTLTNSVNLLQANKKLNEWIQKTYDKIKSWNT
jgi:predicted ATP-dependent endonuclease of OLD family